MKLILAIMFAMLTAAAFVVGGYLGLKKDKAHRELAQATMRLETEKMELQKALDGNSDLIGETQRMSAELDRNAAEIKRVESEFSEHLAATGDSTTPIIQMVISQSVTDRSWVSYPFRLRLYGLADSVYSSMEKLLTQVPLIKLVSIEGSVAKDTLNIRFEGQALFPTWQNTADYLDNLN